MKKILCCIAFFCVAAAAFCCACDKAHAHTYNDEVVSATCTEKGYTIRKCACGDEYISDEKEALGHCFNEWEILKQPTRFEKGLKTRKCTRNGCEFSESVEFGDVQPLDDCLEYEFKDSEVIVKGFKKGCEKAELVIPNGTTSIDKNAFYGCKVLTKVTIADTVTHIGKLSFAGCDGLIVITMGDGVTEIDEGAFHSCSNLKSVSIGKNLKTIGFLAFYSCSSLENITVDKENTTFYSVNDCLIKKESKSLVLGCKNSIIPSDGSVVEIGGYSFRGCSGLKNITIPHGVKTIGFGAFYGCFGLTNVVISDTVTEISANAFDLCGALTTVTIPSSVTVIGDQAFRNCGKLTTIIYLGNEEQWNSVRKGYQWDDFTNYTIEYNG